MRDDAVDQIRRVLGDCPLFEAITADELRALAGETECRLYGRHVLTEHPSERDGLFLLVRGCVRLYRRGGSGEVTLALLQPGDIFGVMTPDPYDDSESRFEAVSGRTEIYHFPRAAINELVARRPEVAIRALRLVGRRLDAAYDRMEDLALTDITARLRRALARLARRNCDGVIERTQEELAWLIGASRGDVARALHELRREGMVNTQHRRIEVPDAAVLAPELFQG